jgi:hypothetical protein
VGKYLLTGRLGRGGMGVVYEARDTLLERPVALKVLTTTEAAAWRRCLREARAAARLNHPNVVALYEAEQRDGLCYLVMELVPGGSAHDVLQKQGALPWPAATRVIADACRGLAAAHAAGLIHRDVKPANLMRAPDGSTKLSDFGLARAAEQTGPSVLSSLRAGGTPQYMSPEQSRGEPLDPRTDLYSLGATYYALLVGRPPYPGDAPLPLMYAHCSQPVPDPRADRPEVPEGCAAIVRRAMAKYPAERYRTAADMLAALEAVLAARAPGGPPAAPREEPWDRARSAVGAALLGLLLLAMLLLLAAWHWLGGARFFPPAGHNFLPAGILTGESGHGAPTRLPTRPAPVGAAFRAGALFQTGAPMNLFRSRSTRGRGKTFAPRLEALEDRNLLSCMVDPSMHPLLTITGDPTDHHVVIMDNGTAGPGNVTVQCDNVTTPVPYSINKIVVKTLGGNDTVQYQLPNGLQPGVARTVNADLGDGNNTFLSTIGGNLLARSSLQLTVFGGTGQDVLLAKAVSDFRIDAGAMLGVHLYGGAGNDSIQVNYQTQLNGILCLDLGGGAGNDTVSANVTIDAGSSGVLTCLSHPATVSGGTGTNNLTFNVFNNGSAGVFAHLDAVPGDIVHHTANVTL